MLNKVLSWISHHRLLDALLILLLLGLVVLSWWDPSEMRKKGRDATRIADLDRLDRAIKFYLRNNADKPKLCDDCEVGTIFSYKTISSSSTKVIESREVGGRGWIPIDFSLNAGFNKTPILVLSVDPLDTDPYVYTFTSSLGGNYKLTVPLEAKDSQEKMANDGGTNPLLFEVGTDLKLAP
ncbi:MAG: hypothetical protein A3F35_03235 [Candidatus Woykebacteria bacterium RIFCSPHIGHO2_12_FULL_45_10]|uniref:Type II secretion system protein GspG C-terminal domain-containing protein n=1 Tax=Candidatus Woykebacteria bacterium RIFCSPHIGHO2_12_FULL_45_10 TaxID=1802603 RepID=A0A1G1WR78_9BACT|nr:MAG: hypothetical protein A3F35_03235 [Candidatus Woykebacteria bacterium RIFCSPHIGHO2_12_FULL_45_10]